MKRVLCLIFALGLLLSACAAGTSPENEGSQQDSAAAQTAETQAPAKPLTDEELTLVQDMLRAYIQHDSTANFTVCTDYGVDYKYENYPLLNTVMFLKNDQNIFCEDFISTSYPADWDENFSEESYQSTATSYRNLSWNAMNENAYIYRCVHKNGTWGYYQSSAPSSSDAFSWTFSDDSDPGYTGVDGGSVEQWKHSFASMPKYNFHDFLNGLLEDEALCRETVRLSKETFLSRSRYCVTIPVHSDYLQILVPYAYRCLFSNFADSTLNPVHAYNTPLIPGEVQISLYFQESDFRCVGEVIDATPCAGNIQEALLKSPKILPGSGKYTVEKHYMPGVFRQVPGGFPEVSALDPYKLTLKKRQAGGSRTIHSQQPISYDAMTGDFTVMDGSFPAATICAYAKSLEDSNNLMFWLNLDVVSYVTEKETLPYADGRFEATLYTLSMKELFNDDQRDDLGYIVKLENKQDHEGILIMCWDRDRIIEIANGIRFDA